MTGAPLHRPSTRRGPLSVVLALAASLGPACASDPKANPYPAPPPLDGSASVGGDASSGPSDPNVTITITAPLDGAILGAAGSAEVRATIAVSSGAGSLDPQSVRATVEGASSGNLTAAASVVPAPLVSAGTGDYRGKLSLSSLPSGDYVLSISASTTTGTRAHASVAIKVDTGPAITVVTPQPAEHYRGLLNIEVTVDSDPYGATALPLDATVGGLPVVLAQVGTGNNFRGTIDFHQPIPPLVGPQLLIVVARNARGTRSETRTPFVIDEAGPVITGTSPPPGAVTGGVVRIEAVINDDAGVLPSSVQVLIGNVTDPKFKLPLTADAKGVYGILFDTAKLTNCGLDGAAGLCLVFPTLSFRAADLLGNETTVAYEIAIDNQPPLLDLDPPQVRDSKLDLGLRCSWSFDPLGRNNLIGDMPADGCMVSQVFDLRARVEDTGNPAGGLKQAPIAGLDPDTVAAYILDDTSQPLVVDGDNDGFCDKINPKLIPTTSPPTKNTEVLKVRLGGVKPAGSADFTPDPSVATLAPLCFPGKDPDAPPDLCTVSQPSIVISYAGGESAIWSVEPIDDRWCVGSPFDTFANNIGEGWACIAVAGSDRNGNGGVSAPLRVWVSYRQQGAFCPAPPPTASTPPDCTGKFDKATDVVSARPCQSRRYRPGEICFLGDCF